jgi:hypothetical protein
LWCNGRRRGARVRVPSGTGRQSGVFSRAGSVEDRVRGSRRRAGRRVRDHEQHEGVLSAARIGPSASSQALAYSTLTGLPRPPRPPRWRQWAEARRRLRSARAYRRRGKPHRTPVECMALFRTVPRSELKRVGRYQTSRPLSPTTGGRRHSSGRRRSTDLGVHAGRR